MITFEQLEALRTIVAAGTFTRAADQLYLTQPALSQRIKHLEQALGAEIFDRTHRGRRIGLTPAGEAVLRFANHVSEDLDSLVQEIGKIQGEIPRKTLNIAVGPNAARWVLPDILTQYQHQEPDVRLNIVPSVGISGLINQIVMDGSAELGISGETGRDPRLAAVPLIVYHLMAVVSRDHPLAVVPPPPDDDMLDYQFALFPIPASTIRQALEKKAQSIGKRLDVVIESNDFDVLKNAALRGLVVTIMPDLMMQDELRSGLLIPVTALGMPHDMQIDLVYDSSRRLSAAAEAFLDIARAEASLSVPELTAGHA